MKAEIDLTRSGGIYDGLEPDSYDHACTVPGSPELVFRFTDFINQPFAELRKELPGDVFEAIRATHGFPFPRPPFYGTSGKDGLAIYYCWKRVEQEEQLLLIVGFGEFQPARYIVHLEAIWRLQAE